MKITWWLTILMLTSSHFVWASPNGPLIKDFGTAYPIPERTFRLPDKPALHAVFDIYDDRKKVANHNQLIDSIARLLNMHHQTGNDITKFKIFAVVHGRGIYDVLNDKAYQSRFGRKNPNRSLVKALQQAGVRFVVCGQTMKFAGINHSELIENVDVGLSAMSTLIFLQNKGYAYIRQ